MLRAIFFALFLGGCATEVRDPKSGKIVFRTYGDSTNISYSGPGYSFHADSLNHSIPTMAAGSAAAKTIQSAGTFGTATTILPGIIR